MGCEDFVSFSEEEQERRRGGHFGSSPLNICDLFYIQIHFIHLQKLGMLHGIHAIYLIDLFSS